MGQGVPGESVRLLDAEGRPFEARWWAAASDGAPGATRGVALFLHGHGAHPGLYQRGIIQACLAQGLSVLAPVHLDATRGAWANVVGASSGFAARRAQTIAAAAWLDRTHPTLPGVVVGHSYGTLLAAMLGGAMPAVGVPVWARMKAMVAFSSPGVLSMMNPAQDFASLRVPLLMVTGTRDLVANGGANWETHQAYFDHSAVPGSAEVVVEGGGHELIREAEGAAWRDAAARYARLALSGAVDDASQWLPPPATITPRWRMRQR